MKRQLIVFRLGQGDFALDILAVREITVLREITSVPETADYVAGAMNLRGALIPILDLRKRMHQLAVANTEETRVIIARNGDRQLGLIVDQASDFIRVEEGEIEPPPRIFQEIGAVYVQGVIRRGEQVIALIDLMQALSGVVLRELDEVILGMSRMEKVSAREVKAALVA
ncbi:MAG: chemotaxis protein CheW [Blastocatellia bacterium]